MPGPASFAPRPSSESPPSSPHRSEELLELGDGRAFHPLGGPPADAEEGGRRHDHEGGRAVQQASTYEHFSVIFAQELQREAELLSVFRVDGDGQGRILWMALSADLVERLNAELGTV